MKENVNNIETVHLHWGLQLIFDESQKEGNNEIWIDCYELTKFLYRSRSEVAKVEDSKEWRRVQEMQDPEVEKRRKKEVAGFLFRLPEYGADDIIKQGISQETGGLNGKEIRCKSRRMITIMCSRL